MTGRHATSSRGNISRSARSWQRVSQPLFHLGLSPPRRLPPFRAPAFARPAGDPQPLPYLADLDDQQLGGFDLTAEVYLHTDTMRRADCPPHLVSRGNLRDMYWTFAQMLAHHASNGCDLRPGDLLASGTISGADPTARGCLLEMTRGGNEPIPLPDGTQRTFLEDGDEVSLRAFCQGSNAVRIGFGECRGTLIAAR